jgi:MFS family permease
MGDFLAFRRMITTIIIQIVFWLGLIGIIVGGILIIIDANDPYYGWEWEGVVAGVLTLILGPIIWRVYCETLILFFRMNETLTDIRKILRKKRKDEKLSIEEDSFE